MITENENYQPPKVSYALMEKVLLRGDMKELDSKERLSYISMLCKSLKLNVLTRPFEYIDFKGKLTLYARKDATDQLRSIYKVSVHKLESKFLDDIYYVTAYVSTPDTRVDIGTGAVYIKNIFGDNLANAIMKAETKAKRRATLSICGLGMLDESEIDTLPGETTTYNAVKEVAIINRIESSKTIDDLRIAHNEANAYYHQIKNIDLKNKFYELVQNKKQQLQNIPQIDTKEPEPEIEKVSLSI